MEVKCPLEAQDGKKGKKVVEVKNSKKENGTKASENQPTNISKGFID